MKTLFASTLPLLLLCSAVAEKWTYDDLLEIKRDGFRPYEEVKDSPTVKNWPTSCNNEDHTVTVMKTKQTAGDATKYEDDPKPVVIKGMECRPDLDEVVFFGNNEHTFVTDEKLHCTRIVSCTHAKTANKNDNHCVKENLAVANPRDKAHQKVDIYDANVELTSFEAMDDRFAFKLDPKCDVRFDLAGAANGTFARRFVNKYPPNKSTKHFNGPDIHAVPSVILNEDLVYLKKIGQYFPTTNGWEQIKMKETMPCGQSCYDADIVTMSFPGNVDVAFSLLVKSTCHSITICVDLHDDGNCAPFEMMHIFPRHGMVIMPNRPRAIPMKFLRKNQDTTIIHLEASKETFTVTSPFRVRAYSDQIKTGKFAFRATAADCWIPNIGITTGGMNGNAHVTVNEDASKIANVKNDQGAQIVFSTHEAANLTTPSGGKEELDATASFETTDAVANGLGNSAHGKVYQRKDLERNGWSIWMVFVGFVAGMLGALFVAFIGLYLGRRSLYGDWYRAMYKRYGADASMMTGQTMNTMGTTGAMTVGTGMGGTTMGGTTAGGTTGGNSTMGGTTASPTETGKSEMGTTTGNKTDMVTM